LGRIDDPRKRSEAEFHDRRERDRRSMLPEDFETKYSNKRWYAVTGKSHRYVESLLDRWAPGARSLDYCCGVGGSSLELARRGAFVHGIDISPESVKTAATTLADAGYAANSEFRVMDAENLEFPDDYFDLIICAGVLHHLDVQAAFPQLARVLKPSGHVVCSEALGYNPAIRLYRRLTPGLRTEWEADHILTLRELKLAGRWFSRVEVRYFHLTDLLAVPLRKTSAFQAALAALHRVDDVLLRIPGLQLMAWQMIFTLASPRRAHST
jgi:ubiquinone/menaquinone biosynthesis C-methylase UbiE